MKAYFQLPALTLLCICSLAKGQAYEKTTIHAGESIPSLSYYLFPSFTNATVKLKTGGLLVSKMNFNLLICEMQFIDAGNDTLSITKPEDVDSITLGNNIFFFNNGYYEIFASAVHIKLAVLRKVSYEPVKIGALGIPNHTGTGIQSYTSLVTNTGEKKLVMNEDVDITRETAYFLIADNMKMIKANKAGFVKLFPGSEQLFQTYLKQNKTDFNNQTDLEKLFSFCIAQH